MKNNLWSALRNPFENPTRNSFKLMNLIATDHHDKLKAAAAQDAGLLPLYRLYEPTYSQFQEAFTAATTNVSKYRVSTRRVETLFDELNNTKIRHWDVAIQYHYPSETLDYMSLMPDHREPFQKGGYEMRIKELKSLNERLLDYPTMATVRNEVEQYISDLVAARTRQQGLELNKKQLSGKLEDARRELSAMLHATLSFLTYYYRNDVSVVEQFFVLQYLRTETKPEPKEKEEEKPKEEETNAEPTEEAINELENEAADTEEETIE